MSVIEEVKQRVDIVDVVGQYTALAKSGRTLKGLCPFHKEKTPSFFVYPEQQSWHCFGACSTGGDVFSFIMKKEGIAFPDALHLLADRVGVDISVRPETTARKDEREKFYRINGVACQYYHDLLLNSSAASKAREYVIARGLSPETVERFKLGFSLNSWDAIKEYMIKQGYNERELVESGLLIEKENGGSYARFRNRLMFPIRDNRGNVTGFGARALDDSLPKYMNSPQTAVFDKSGSIYAIDLASSGIKDRDVAVVVEGFMDVIMAHQSGYTNVVASMGTALTERQITILKRMTKNVTLALDADVAGQEAMLRSVDYENVLGSEIKVVVLPDGKDPDSVIRENPGLWEDLLTKAAPVMDYTFEMVTDGLDLATAKDKSIAVERLLPVIARLKNYAYVDHYLEKLGALTGIRKTKLEAALSEFNTGAGGIKGNEKANKPGLKPPRSLYSDPREEYCLALLFKHPELKENEELPLPEYFESTENREIFTVIRQAGDILSLKEELDGFLREHLDSIITRMNMIIIDYRIEEKYIDCVLHLREKYLRNLAKQGVEVSAQLRDVFARRGRGAGLKGGIK